jgi:hypothetical protein
MLETTYTLRLSQLQKITPDLKKYMWQKLKPYKPLESIDFDHKEEKSNEHSKDQIIIENIDIDQTITSKETLVNLMNQ